MANRDKMPEPLSLEEYAAQGVRDWAEPALDLPVLGRLPDIGSPQPDVDWGFITDNEGMELNGYVPDDKKTGLPLDQSGVTIAAGFDLGQRNVSDLKALKLSPELIQRFTPYLGLKRTDAQGALKIPLAITSDEALAINRAVKDQRYKNMASSYNAATTRNYGAGQAPQFEDLPREAQTAILSTAYQYGDLARKTPNYWQQITNGDWQGAHGNLMAFGDRYDSRREREAAKLKEAIDSGRLPGAPPPRAGGR